MASAECHLVTGGGGYPGSRLACELVKRGHRVLILDLHPPVDLVELPEGMEFVKVSAVPCFCASIIFLCSPIIYCISDSDIYIYIYIYMTKVIK